jgi:predicted NAD/FAD-binding protein
MPITERKRIAIVGSGVSGIAALWVSPVCDRNQSSKELEFESKTDLLVCQALNEHSDHEVNLYEAGDYVGGHTHTVTFERGYCS